MVSDFGASNFLTTIFSEAFEDVLFTKALENCLGLTKDQETPLDGTQKHWTHHVYAKTVRDLVSRVEQKRSEVFDAHEGEIGSQWLNVFFSREIRPGTC